MSQPALRQVLALINQVLQGTVLSSLHLLAYLIVTATLRSKCFQYSHFTDKGSTSERLRPFPDVTQLLNVSWFQSHNRTLAKKTQNL